jgi:molecular chaperone DnaJ
MTTTHYQTLQVNPRATTAEIKQAYRQLAKQHHPDVNQSSSSAVDRIITINAAYEVLSDPRRKQDYDRSLQRNLPTEIDERIANNRATRHPKTKTAVPDIDSEIEIWLNSVYAPVNRSITAILKPFKTKLIELSADPFDDDLLGNFAAYLLDCQRHLKKAEQHFHSLPNPANLAGIASSIYYCLGRLGDAIEELNRYTTCYNDEYLHSGQELFKIAAGLQKEAKSQLKSIY